MPIHYGNKYFFFKINWINSFILSVLYTLGLRVFRFIIENRKPFASLKDILNSKQKMISSQRLSRFQSAGELLEELERV